MFILDACEGIGNVVAIAKLALRIIMIIGPILLILWGSIDLIKSIVQGKEEDIKKSQKILVRRLISAVLLLLLPALVGWAMGLIGSKNWKTCWNNTPAGINYNVDEDNIE